MQARKRAPQCAISAPITAAKRKLDYNRSSYGRLAASGEAQLVSVYLSRVTRLLPCICPPLLLLLQGRRQELRVPHLPSGDGARETLGAQCICT